MTLTFYTHISSLNQLVYFLFYRFFSQQVSVEGRNKNKNKIHSDHFPVELKSKETQLPVLYWHESEGNKKIKLKKKSLLFFFQFPKNWVGRVCKTKN